MVSISKVVIENFRSVKSASFTTGSLCTLIGENNSGKSTLMRALNLVLGESWPSERSFDESDFHLRDTSGPIQIDVFFDEPWEEWRNRAANKVGGFRLKCKVYEKRTKTKSAGQLKVDFVCIGPSGRELTYPSVAGDYRSAPYPLSVTSEMRARVPLLYVDVMREYGRQAPSARWSILRKLMDHVLVGFSSDKLPVDYAQADGTVVRITRAQAFERAIAEAYTYLRTPEFEDLETRLAANAVEHMGMTPGTGSLELQFSLHDPANAYKSLELLISQMNMVSTAQEVGAGLQSAIVVAIFKTYEELRRSGAIFAIEEPEAFLHPQKARYFSEVLRGIADSGNQVILTTHSPFFVRLDAPESVAVVRRTDAGGTTVAQSGQVDIAADLRAVLRMRNSINVAKGEMLFARRILFVEGDTELSAMPFIFKRLGLDGDREGVAVIDCDGKPNIPFFVGIAKAFGIPFVVLADRDNPANPAQVRDTEAVMACCPPEDVFLLAPDFESECGYSTGRYKAVSAHRFFESLPPPAIPAAVAAAINRLMTM
jgi:putative ATP-dependent endonuclease of the OLD family